MILIVCEVDLGVRADFGAGSGQNSKIGFEVGSGFKPDSGCGADYNIVIRSRVAIFFKQTIEALLKA